MYYKRIIFLSITILYIIVMEKSLRERQIREILDEDILINKRVSDITRLRIRGLTEEGEAIQQGRRNAEIESKTSETISKINGILEAKINDGLSLVMGTGTSNPRITHYLNLFNNSVLINLYNSVVNEYRKGKNSTQTTAIIEAQFQTLDDNVSKLIKTIAEIINQKKDQEKYLHREILTYSIYDLIQNHIYTNNFSTITEKDIMTNIYKILSGNINWKQEIEAVQLKGSNNLFALAEDDVNLIDDIKAQQKGKQDAMIQEKASKAKVGDIDIFNKAREIYNDEIKKVENDLDLFLIQKEQDINVIATQYNNGVLLSISQIQQLQTALNKFDTFIKKGLPKIQTKFLIDVAIFKTNPKAKTEIDNIKAVIETEIQKLPFVAVDQANIDNVMASFNPIDPPTYGYTRARIGPTALALERLIRTCFTGAITALNVIRAEPNLLVEETLQVDAEVKQAKIEAANKITQFSRN